MSLVFLVLQFFALFSEGFFALGVFIKQLAVLLLLDLHFHVCLQFAAFTNVGLEIT